MKDNSITKTYKLTFNEYVRIRQALSMGIATELNIIENYKKVNITNLIKGCEDEITKLKDLDEKLLKQSLKQNKI